MATEIIIVGGFLDAPGQDDLLTRLKADVSDEVTWEWISCDALHHFEAPRGPMNRLAEKLKARRIALRKNPDSISSQDLRVIKLFDIHARTANILYRCWSEPVLPPVEVRTSTDFINWLASPESNLFPPREWWAGLAEAALVAILCKLLRNKSWNSTVQGHAWTKEGDLLTQSPVVRDDRPKVTIEARRILPTLDGGLLLTKGSRQGQTPKEWSVDKRFLTAVKRAMTSNSLAPLQEFDCLKGLLSRIAQDEDKAYRLDVDIVTEKVRFVCRQRN